MHRRSFLTGVSLSLALPGLAQARNFSGFLGSLRARALADGIPPAIVAQTTRNLTPNAAILKLDHHQAEFTETWDDYYSHVLSHARLRAGAQKAAQTRNLLAAVTSRYGVGAEPLLGIWGIETNYGADQGDFSVIDALATLAWDRGSPFFAGQAIDAMRIIASGAAPAAKLLGSYAGAMGQPQFMPGIYLSTAVSFAGNGHPDIWDSDADTLASMANYLMKYGWRPEQPSSEPVFAPDLTPAQTGRKVVRSLAEWQRAGVQRLPGAPILPGDTQASVLLPGGAGGEAFLIYANFHVIRRYNASDFYALAVGALGRSVLSA